jgi:hypothetical protein
MDGADVSAPRISPGKLRKVAAWEYLVRFCFGGTVAMLAWLAGKAWGTTMTGMLLAFPAILPASLTLVKRHEGQRAVEQDARGSQVGVLGLAAFAAIAAGTIAVWPVSISLIAATLGWLGVSILTWWLVLRRNR